MREKEHFLIHDKGISFLMIAVFCLSFFVVIHVVKIQNRQNIGKEQKSREQYMSCRMYRYPGDDVIIEDEGEEVQERHLHVDRLKITQGNVILVVYTLVGNAYYSAPLHLVISYNEPLVEELKEGRYPSESELIHGRKCIVVGDRLLHFAEQKGESRVLTIDNESYEILGVLKDNTGNGMDDRLFAFANCIADKTVEAINEESFFEIEYGSNLGTVEQTNELEEWLYQFRFPEYFSVVDQMELEEGGDAAYVVHFIQQYNQYVLHVLFAFCMGACMLVSSVWIKRRRKEMVIRKAIGSGYGKIFGLLFRDIGVMVLLSVLIDLILFAIHSIVTGEVWLEQVYLWDNFIYFVVVSLIMIAITLLQPFYEVITISPSEGTRAL